MFGVTNFSLKVKTLKGFNDFSGGENIKKFQTGCAATNKSVGRLFFWPPKKHNKQTDTHSS